MQHQTLIVRRLGMQDYASVWQAMHDFTDQRSENCADEVWLVEHPPVFTQGQAGKAEHLLACGDIPVIQSDRGVRSPTMVRVKSLCMCWWICAVAVSVFASWSAISKTVINTLAHFSLTAAARVPMPPASILIIKICSLGLRIRRGCSFHGLALNINMDLSPFTRINPCGYAGMEMTQTKDLGGPETVAEVEPVLVQEFIKLLGYSGAEYSSWKPLTNE
ncbi:lipoyl(octanoyl) transferase LipB [Plesiomonas shigelloides subsp. oncorhynchi]|nr:lipoyl(octanoyl) transferase LipB [Plesiomonas shigelloides]